MRSLGAPPADGEDAMDAGAEEREEKDGSGEIEEAAELAAAFLTIGGDVVFCAARLHWGSVLT